MDELIIFDHESKEMTTMSFSQDESNQGKVEYLCKILCKNGMILLDDVKYTYELLAEFICVLSTRNITFDLAKVCNLFKQDLINIARLNSENVQKWIENHPEIESSKNDNVD